MDEEYLLLERTENCSNEKRFESMKKENNEIYPDDDDYSFSSLGKSNHSLNINGKNQDENFEESFNYPNVKEGYFKISFFNNQRFFRKKSKTSSMSIEIW